MAKRLQDAGINAPEHAQDKAIKRALISVTNKQGVVEFARALSDEFGIEIVSTGGSAKVLQAAGIEVRPIDDLTGFPEMMDGRVKTLHPRVHGGLLARRDLDLHMAAAKEHGVEMIDMVVVNLYAFEDTVAREDASFADAIENIDIGGPSMLRSAAKNHQFVTVVTSPTQYAGVLDEMRAHSGATTLATRRTLAKEVFALTSAYDNAIYSYLHGAALASAQTSAQATNWPPQERLFLKLTDELRYGENPHQKAAFYQSGSSLIATSLATTLAAQPNPQPNPLSDPGPNPEHQLASARKLQGKPLSYNNYLDLDAAWAAVREFSDPTCVIVKHLTPCGIASHSDITTAYKRAHDVDSVSAFGGVMAFNRPVPTSVVEAIYANGQFIEAVIAPSYDQAAIELFKEKPNARILATGGINAPGVQIDYRSVEGGILAMTADVVAEDPANFTVASKREPSAAEMTELLFAWKACKSVKSNAIVIAKDATTVGIGGGQPNRVNSAQIACTQAGEAAKGAVAASDAFMPFADSLELLVQAGVTALIQPGGSIRDAEVLALADAHNVAVVFTGHRHFRH